jgi:DNA polymerase-3 subunit alpha
VPAVSPRERLAWEKEALGVYLSDHPFQEAARWLRTRVTATTASLSEETGSEKVTLAGVLSGVRRILTKKRETMVVAQLEDLHGTIEVVVFPRTLERTAELWQDDAIVIVEGRLDTGRAGRDERPSRQVICEAAEAWTPPPPGSEPPPEEAALPAGAESALPAGTSAPAAEADYSATGAAPHGADLPALPTRHLRLRFVREGDDDADFGRLRSLHALLTRESGPDTYELLLVQGDAEYRLLVPEPRVACTPAVEDALRRLLGPANVQVV